jgi:uncharacterized membrane protein YvbJ
MKRLMRRKAKAFPKMATCPHCGADIKANAIVCPECGSDDQTGWSSHTYLDEIYLPDEESYEQIRLNEFGDSKNHREKHQRRTLILIVAITLLVVIVIGFIFHIR